MKGVIPLIIGLVFVSSIPVFALEENGVIEMPFTENPPIIDGIFTSEDEWQDASETVIQNENSIFYVYVKHDRENIYVFIDAIE